MRAHPLVANRMRVRNNHNLIANHITDKIVIFHVTKFHFVYDERKGSLSVVDKSGFVDFFGITFRKRNWLEKIRWV